MGKQKGTMGKFGKFGRTKAVLALGLLAALITLCPLEVRAAGSAPVPHFEQVAQIQELGCPLTHSAQAAECSGNGSQPALSSSLAQRDTDSTYQISSAQHGTSHGFLEELLQKGTDRDAAESP